MICLDEFGPLEIKPIAGQCWAVKRKPDRQPATYTRTHGVRHLLAAYDLKDDKFYAHNKPRKSHKELLQFLKVLRRRYSRKERLYIVLDNFSPHHKQIIKDWAANNNIELIYTPTYASWLNRLNAILGPYANLFLGTLITWITESWPKPSNTIFAGEIAMHGIRKF